MAPRRHEVMGMGSEVPSPNWLLFDGVEIDATGRRVFIDRREVSFEPKAFDVLLLFARQPGRVFGRDEILDAVWGHRHITPAVLSRVILLLRQALGESGEHPQYIRTLHGVGYRFDAEVRTSAQRPGEPASSTEPLNLSLKQTFGDATNGPAMTAALEPSTPATSTPLPERRTFSVRRLAVAAIVLALTAAGAAVWLRHPAKAPASTSARPTLVVLPLRSIGDATAEASFADGLSEELTTRLARVEGLAMISQTSATLAQQRQLGLDELAKQLHVSHAIEGSLRQSGDQLRIDLRLIEIPGGRTVWAQAYDRKLADVFAVERDIAIAVANALTLRLGLPAKSEGGIDGTTYREYLQLRTALLKPEFMANASGHKDARTALRELIARAPDFAQAHGLLAHSLIYRDSNLENSPDRVLEAEREATRALQLDADNTDAHITLAIIARQRLDWETAHTEIERAITLDPSDVLARVTQVWMLLALGYRDAALFAIEAAHRSDPLNIPAAISRARVLDTLGRHDEAKSAFDEALPLGQGVPEYIVYARWHNAVWRHDYAAAMELAAHMPEQHGFREAYVAVTRALQDPSLWPQAMPAIEESERRTGRYNFARVLAPGNDLHETLASFETMMRNDFPSYYVLVWQPEFGAVRRDPAFQDYIRRTHILEYWRTHGFPPQCRPDGDGAACD